MPTRASTATAEATAVAVRPGPQVAACRLVTGPLSPRLLHRDADGARVALIATGALLLGGDHVVIDVEVGAGAWLELVETAGTVAYDGAGQPTSWTVRVRVAAGGRLRWNALPFVVSDGALVTRATTLALAPGARVLLRETLVLGRTGERGGELAARTDARVDGAPVLVEELDLGPRGRTPGALGPHRVLDQVLALGWRPDPLPDQPQPAAARFDLAGPGALARMLTDATHRTTAIDAIERDWSTAVGPMSHT